MSTFMISFIMAMIAFVLLLLIAYLTRANSKIDYEGGKQLVILIIILVVAIVLVILANINIYLNGTEKEIIKWLFWFRG